jgi:hypothetical protein
LEDKELLSVFNELLSEWKNAESMVINDRNCSIIRDEFEELNKRECEYIERFNKAVKYK